MNRLHRAWALATLTSLPILAVACTEPVASSAVGPGTAEPDAGQAKPADPAIDADSEEDTDAAVPGPADGSTDASPEVPDRLCPSAKSYPGATSPDDQVWGIKDGKLQISSNAGKACVGVLHGGIDQTGDFGASIRVESFSGGKGASFAIEYAVGRSDVSATLANADGSGIAVTTAIKLFGPSDCESQTLVAPAFPVTLSVTRTGDKTTVEARASDGKKATTTCTTGTGRASGNFEAVNSESGAALAVTLDDWIVRGTSSCGNDFSGPKL